MKFTIAAGAEIDLLTKSELSEALADWMVEFRRGKRYRNFSASGVVSGTGTLSVGGLSGAEGMGPEEGFVWSVKRLTIHPLESTDLIYLWRNEPSATTLVEPGIAPSATGSIGAVRRWGANQLVLQAGERLLVTADSMTSGVIVTVAGQALEIPAAQAWSL